MKLPLFETFEAGLFVRDKNQKAGSNSNRGIGPAFRCYSGTGHRTILTGVFAAIRLRVSAVKLLAAFIEAGAFVLRCLEQKDAVRIYYPFL